MKTRVKVVFPATQRDQPSWPYINYDVEARSKQVVAILREKLPEFEFSPAVFHSLEEAERAAETEQEHFDGYLVYMTALWSGIGAYYARNKWPTIIADELYAGSGGLLRVNSMVVKEKLPVVTVASSDFQDVIDAVRLFGVMKKMRQAKILVVADGESWGARGDVVARVEEVFGVQVTQIDSGMLHSYYERSDPDVAMMWKDKWVREALKVVEPSEEEILRSARMYLALKQAMMEAEADAITVDCLGLYYGGRLFAYPCLGFFQLNNEGLTGVCEADVESTVTQLLIRYLTGRPGYVSDPVIDTATNQIVYAHCVATNRVFGSTGLHNPYILRSHAEDRKGASVQSLLPLGHTVTTLKVSAQHKAFAIHTGRSVANVEDDKACRTKLAAEVDARRVLENYHDEIFSWHRVTCYGDYRQPFIDLAKLYGLEIFEEDR